MSLNAFKKVFLAATAISNQPFQGRFEKLLSSNAKIAFANLGAFGHIVENLECPKSKAEIQQWNEKHEKRYNSFMIFSKCKREAVVMPTQLQKVITDSSDDRFKSMSKKYPNLSKHYPLTFKDILSTFKFHKENFTWNGNASDDDKAYMNVQMDPLKTIIKSEFVEKLLVEASAIYEVAKTLKRLSDQARFKKLYEPNRDFAKEHPIPFKYAVQNLEFDSKAFRKYARRYIVTGTNRDTTAELSAIYLMGLRGTANMGEKKKAEVKTELMKEINKDMQEMDDFIKDFKETYKEKEERILELQRDQLYEYLVSSSTSETSSLSTSETSSLSTSETSSLSTSENSL